MTEQSRLRYGHSEADRRHLIHGRYFQIAGAIVQDQSAAYICHADTVAIQSSSRFTKDSGIRNGNQNEISLLLNAQADESVTLAAGNAMYNGVLNERLDG